jgi:hypothetical protein
MILQRVVAGFLIGFVAVLTFHQAAIGLMNAYGLVPNPPFRMNPVGPLGVPAVFNAAFWGGVWGIAIFLATERMRSDRLRVLTALAIGAIGASAVGWFVVAPLKGLPVANGWNVAAMWRAPLINGVFGLGCGLMASGVAALIGARR